MVPYIWNQQSFVNGKLTLSNILESTDSINKYLMEGDNADIVFLNFSSISL